MQRRAPSSSAAGGSAAEGVACSSAVQQDNAHSVLLSVNCLTNPPPIHINPSASNSPRGLSTTTLPCHSGTSSHPSVPTSAAIQPESPRSIPSTSNNSPYNEDPSMLSTSKHPRSSTTKTSNTHISSRRRRRSQRATAHLRGPPELEAAVAIAIRNLESDIYEWWCANYKPGSPLPTAAFLKSRSSRIRRAAEAVDEADRLLNEAIYGKPRNSRGVAVTSRRTGRSRDVASGSDRLL
ncbi:hypothetical protein BU17DRAFT_93235 [Hysterangium stoloniferum]|nr:hypothetical protein BU17DRAFT_93235 [Hysterangium stoloniferum]